MRAVHPPPAASRSTVRIVPSTGRPTTRNPVVDRIGPYALPAQFSGFTLEALMEGGTTVARDDM